MPRRVDGLEGKFPFAMLKISVCPDTRRYLVNSRAVRLPQGGGTGMEILHGKSTSVLGSTGSVPTPLPLALEQHQMPALCRKIQNLFKVLGISLLRYLKYVNTFGLFRYSEILFNEAH